MLEPERGVIRRLVAGLAGTELSIDLGTSNILIFQKGKGIVVNEPSVIAFSDQRPSTRKVLAVGREAKARIGKNPEHISLARPLRDGVIADSDLTEAMLQHFINKLRGRIPGTRPLLVISLPWGITEIEKTAVRHAGQTCGARAVHLVYEPMAAALGSGLNVLAPRGHLIVDIGGGTTEVALISLGGVVDCQSIRVGGDRMNDQILAFIKDNFNLAIGESTAEELKHALATAYPEKEVRISDVKGLDLRSGLPKAVTVTSEAIGLAISTSLINIAEAVREVLSRTPPELAADVIEDGIMLTGGSALIKNIDTYLQNYLGLPVVRAKDPLCSVALGGGLALESMKLLETISLS